VHTHALLFIKKNKSCIVLVHIDIDFIFICKQMQTQSKLDIVDEKYKRTIVYRILNMRPPTGRPQVFVGATHRTLDERIAEHRRQRVGLAWEILEQGKFDIMIIHHWECDTLREVLTLSRSMRERASLKRRINTLNWQPHQGLECHVIQ
jgi:hypothetical protein